MHLDSALSVRIFMSGGTAPSLWLGALGTVKRRLPPYFIETLPGWGPEPGTRDTLPMTYDTFSWLYCLSHVQP